MNNRTNVARISDVAKRAGVSVSTVSLVLNGRGNISAATIAKVRAAVRELNYQPHHAARNLASRQANSVGLLLPSATPVSDEFFSLFLAGVVDALHQAEFLLVLLPASTDPQASARSVAQAAAAKRIDGVILLEVAPQDSRLQLLHEQGIPTALFGQTDLPIPWVDVDNSLGGELAANHLLDLGHRRLAHIAAPHQYWYATERRRGFESAVIDRLGPDADLTTIETALTAEAGYEAAEKALQRAAPPTAIFAASDVVARGVVRYAQDHNLDVPGQLSVVGFDDTPLARWGSLSLTSISQDPHNIGVQVGGLLLRYLKNGEPTHKRVVPSIQVRASTAPPAPDAHDNPPSRRKNTSL